LHCVFFVYRKRGKYQLNLFKRSVRFHGSSFNFSIDYWNVIKGFLLPLPDDTHMIFVIGLDQPLKIGNTFYSYIGMQFKKEYHEVIKVNLDYEERKEEKLRELDEEYEGPLFEIVG